MEQGNRNTAQRAVNAENDFVALVREFIGCTDAEARAVTRYYIKNRFAKLDYVGGRITVKHGAFLGERVLRAALGEALKG